MGVGAFGSIGNWNYKAFIFNGADADAIASKTSYGIRKGRKKGGSDDSNATQNASTYAVVIRGDYQFDSMYNDAPNASNYYYNHRYCSLLPNSTTPIGRSLFY